MTAASRVRKRELLPPEPAYNRHARGVVCALRLNPAVMVRVQALATSIGKTRGYVLRQAVEAGMQNLNLKAEK